jgi:hypothetical protein
MGPPMRSISHPVLLGAVLLVRVSTGSPAAGYDGDFNGVISRQVLESYLARAVTHAGLCASSPEPTTRTLEDDVRMLTDIGAKLVGRAAFAWELPANEEHHFRQVRAAAKKVHQADPGILLQACIFEIVTTEVERIRIPPWAFRAFDLAVEDRPFNYQAMLYEDGLRVDHWRPGASVPDMSKVETRLWFYYRARRYIDGGMEALHFGQVMLMDDADAGHVHWRDLLERVRAYARRHARRHLVLCDAHTHGEVDDGKLLFDFHSFPLRIAEVKGEPEKAVLSTGHVDNMYGRSKGGVTPSGWSCESLPYLVEFDNWGYSGQGGQSIGGCWVWGYDEISWFARQDEAYRRAWLRYAHQWLKEQDEHAFLQMPTRRTLAAPTRDGVRMFRAQAPSASRPDGFGVAETIKEIWRGE